MAGAALSWVDGKAQRDQDLKLFLRVASPERRGEEPKRRCLSIGPRGRGLSNLKPSPKTSGTPLGSCTGRATFAESTPQQPSELSIQARH